MAYAYPILEHVRSLKGPAVEDALLLALDTGGEHDQHRLVNLILERGSSRGLVGLIGHYHAFPAALQDRLVGRIGDLAPNLRAALRSPSRQVRLNVVRLVTRTLLPRLSYLPVLALADSDRDISNQSADCIKAYVDWYLQSERPPAPTREDGVEARNRYAAWCGDRDQLLGSLTTVLEQIDSHGRAELVGLCIDLADDMTEILRTRLRQPASPAGRILYEQAVRRNDRAVVPFLYLMLSVPQSRARAAGRIAGLTGRSLVRELIRQAPRADDPQVIRGLELVRRMAFFETPAWWEQIPDSLASQTVKWISGLGAEPSEKIRWLNQLVSEGSASQRAVALDNLCYWQSEQTTEALKVLMDHPNAEVAEQAANELLGRGCEGLGKMMVERLDHPHPGVRELATERVGQFSFEQFWTQFPSLSGEVQEFASQKLRRVVGDLGPRLTARLADADPEQRMQAVKVIDLTGLAEGVADALLSACDDANPRVRSAVVKLLGRVPGARSEGRVSEALADADRRVRANAIEALEMLRSDAWGDQLIEMLESEDNRIRANAIKALMRMDLATARQNLHQMLTDKSADHRVSALWVVEQIHWFKTAELVLHLAHADPDRRVRRRALHTLGELRRLYRGIRARRPGGKERTAR